MTISAAAVEITNARAAAADRTAAACADVQIARRPLARLDARMRRATRPETIARIQAELDSAVSAYREAMARYAPASREWSRMDIAANAANCAADCTDDAAYRAAYDAAFAAIPDDGYVYDYVDAAYTAAEMAIARMHTPTAPRGWDAAGGLVDDDAEPCRDCGVVLASIAADGWDGRCGDCADAHACADDAGAELDPNGIIPAPAPDAGTDIPDTAPDSARAMMRYALSAHDSACAARDGWRAIAESPSDHDAAIIAARAANNAAANHPDMPMSGYPPNDASRAYDAAYDALRAAYARRDTAKNAAVSAHEWGWVGASWRDAIAAIDAWIAAAIADDDDPMMRYARTNAYDTARRAYADAYAGYYGIRAAIGFPPEIAPK